MFTGLSEALGRIKRLTTRAGGRVLVIEAPFAPELQTGESVAVNGICLTVTDHDKTSFTAAAVAATVRVTTLGHWRVGSVVNLERALRAGDRLGGHFVQGHVDTVGIIRRIVRTADHWTLAVRTSSAGRSLLVQRGSIAVDGISLTIALVQPDGFTVNIIPHTWTATNLHLRRTGDPVNIEYDLLVKAAGRRPDSLTGG